MLAAVLLACSPPTSSEAAYRACTERAAERYPDASPEPLADARITAASPDSVRVASHLTLHGRRLSYTCHAVRRGEWTVAHFRWVDL